MPDKDTTSSSPCHRDRGKTKSTHTGCISQATHASNVALGDPSVNPYGEKLSHAEWNGYNKQLPVQTCSLSVLDFYRLGNGTYRGVTGAYARNRSAYSDEVGNRPQRILEQHIIRGDRRP